MQNGTLYNTTLRKQLHLRFFCGTIECEQNKTRGSDDMIDVNLIRQDAQAIHDRYLKRGKDIDFTEFLKWDEQRKAIIAEVEAMKAQRNKVSAQIPQLKKQGVDVAETIKEMKVLGDTISAKDAAHKSC